MFGFLKSDPGKKLEKEWLRLCKEARDLQRQGKIPEFARKTAEAEDTRLRMERVRTGQADPGPKGGAA